MKLSRLVRFLDPAAALHMDGQRFTVGQVRQSIAAGTWEGGDPEIALQALDYTLDLYNQDRPAHRRHCGWAEAPAPAEARKPRKTRRQPWTPTDGVGGYERIDG